MRMDLKDKQTTQTKSVETESIEKNKHFIRSVEFAVHGIKTVFQEERNMRKHGFFGLLAILAGFIFQLSQMEWLWILLAVFLVLVVEIINTIFENVVDMVTDFHFHPIGKRIKDMAAGAVLLTALFAALIGAIIFIPKLYQLIFR